MPWVKQQRDYYLIFFDLFIPQASTDRSFILFRNTASSPLTILTLTCPSLTNYSLRSRKAGILKYSGNFIRMGQWALYCRLLYLRDTLFSYAIVVSRMGLNLGSQGAVLWNFMVGWVGLWKLLWIMGCEYNNFRHVPYFSEERDDLHTYIHNNFIPMISSTHSITLTHSHPYPKPTKQNPTSYLFNQEQQDLHLFSLLKMLTELNSLVQLQELDKSQELCKKLVRQLDRIDERHRSYGRVRSLVVGALVVVSAGVGEIGEVQGWMEEERMLITQLDSPQYTAKYYLLKLLTLHLQSKHSHIPPPPKSLRQTYKAFQKISLPPSPSHYNPLLWQSHQILELLVYQFILIVQKLSEFQPRRAEFLHKRGLELARRVLGKEHVFARMMENIRDIRKQTNKLIKMQPMSSSSLITTSQPKPRNNSLHKKLHKILNPEQSLSRTHTKTYTQSSEPETNSLSIHKSKMARSDYFHVVARSNQMYLKGRGRAEERGRGGQNGIGNGRDGGIKDLQGHIDVLLNKKMAKDRPGKLPLINGVLTEQSEELEGSRLEKTIEKNTKNNRNPSILFIQQKYTELDNETPPTVPKPDQNQNGTQCQLI